MPPHILLIGGNGKIARLLTPLLLTRSWTVTSLIRTPSQAPSIDTLGTSHPGTLHILPHSLSDVKSPPDAQRILDAVRPDIVIWAAGAGGKGGPETTLAVDRDAAIAFTKASVATQSVRTFITISYLSSRRGSPSWWSEADVQSARKVNEEVLPTYFQAKVAADEVLTVLSRERVRREGKKGVDPEMRFRGVSLRPGTLTDGPAGGVRVGRIGARGETSRATVARTVLAVLDAGFSGWLDVVDGEAEVEGAVRGLVDEGVDTAEGEDWEAAAERVARL